MSAMFAFARRVFSFASQPVQKSHPASTRRDKVAGVPSRVSWCAIGAAALLGLALSGNQANGQTVAHANEFYSGTTANANPYVAADAAGNVYTVQGTNAIRKGSFSSTGVYTETVLSVSPQSPASGIAVDSAGNLYVSENFIAMVPIHQVERFALGTGGTYSAGTAILTTAATALDGVAVDGAGVVYVARDDSKIAVLTPVTGTPGTYTTATLGDGVAAPTGVAVTSSGTIYLSGSDSSIYKLTPDASPATVYTATVAFSVPSPAAGVAVDGAGDVYGIGASNSILELPMGATTAISFRTAGSNPASIAVNAGGTVFFAVGSTVNEAVSGILAPPVQTGGGNESFTVSFAIDSNTTLDALANANVLTLGTPGLDFTLGTGSTCTGAVTAGTVCQVSVKFAPIAPGLRPGAVNLSSNGTVIATALISGTGTGPQVTFSPGTLGTLNASTGTNGPQGLVVDAAGNIFVSNQDANTVQKIAADGTVTTVAGQDGVTCAQRTQACGDGGPATSAQLNQPNALALDGAGNLYIADENDAKIRKVNAATGIISTVAGTGGLCSSTTGGCGEGGPATSAQIDNPTGLAVDAAGNIYLDTDYNNHVLKVAAGSGIISEVAGYGTGADGGQARDASLSAPLGMTLDGQGNLYFFDFARIRKIAFDTGIISTVAGTGNQCSSSTNACGDGGAATSADIYPLDGSGLVVDAGGNLYFSDGDDGRLRVVTTDGLIHTFAGTGSYCGSQTDACGDNGPATSGNLALPAGLALGSDGTFYTADPTINRIRSISATAAKLNFHSTSVGGTSDDSPKTVTLNNVGNAPLIFSAPSSGANPNVSQNFTLGTGTCPSVTTTTATLAAGVSCTQPVSFTPTTGGGTTVSGSVMFTDNNLNSSTGVTQSVALGGSVLAPTGPTITAAFNPTSVSVNGTSTLTFTVTEPSTNTGGLTNVGFSDTLPAGLVVSTPLATTTSCGGTVTATANGTSVTVSGASVPAPGAQCSFSVNVTPTSAGTGSYTTTTSVVTSTESNGTTTASATLTVPQPTITSINPAQGYTTGGNSVTITGTNFIPGSTVTFGGTAATVNSVAANGTSIVVTLPPHAVGTVDVEVTTSNGSVTATSGFTYQSVALTPGTLPDGTYGTAYSQTIQPALALVPTYTFALAAGSSLPAGLSLTAGPAANSATISGTPTAAGTTNFTITTTDGLGISYNTNYSIRIAPALLSVVVDNKSFTYGGTYPTLTGTGSGYKNGDTASSVGLTFATTTPTTNTSTAGTYTISATITSTNYTIAVTTGTLTINKAAPVLTPPTGAAITFGQSLSASALSGGTATFNGSPVTGSFTWTDGTIVPSAGPHTYSVTFTPDAASSANFTTALTTASLTVGKATPSLTAPAASPITYGQTLSASTLTGGSARNPSDNSNVTGSFSWTDGTIAPVPGQQTYSVTFTPDAASAANYSSNTVPVTLTVNTATLALVPPSASTIHYGQLLSASVLTGGSATNATNNAAVPGTYTWTNGSATPPAGSDSLSVTFTPTTNPSYYNTATTTTTVVVTKALPTISAAPTASMLTYGQSLSASTFSGGTVVNPNSGAAVTGTYTWADGTIVPTAGQHTYTVTFTAAGADAPNYLTNTVQVTVTVQKATPQITRAPAASPIVYGAKLSTSSLSNGAASTPGGFAWTDGTQTPAAGTNPYSVTFTPGDTANYNNVVFNVSLFVARATPQITTPPTASAITYGQPLSASTLTGGVGATPGTFSWTNGATVPSAGSTATYSVTFTPTDSNNYNPNTINVALVVNKAAPTINSLPTASAITYGQTLAASTLSGGSASTGGTFAWTDGSFKPNGGTAAYSVTFTPTDTANYGTTTRNVTLTVNPTTQTITFTQPTTPVTYGDAPVALTASANSGLTPTFSVISGPGSITGANMLTVTGAGTIVVAADQAGDNNYSAAAQVRRTVVVNVQPQTITFTQPASPIAYSAGATVALIANGGSSTNPVTFKVLSGPGTISGSTLTITGSGSIIVAADQNGNSNYGTATEVQRTIVVNMASQTITFNQPTSPIPYGSAQTFTVSATGGASGNPVTFAVVSGPGTINGSTVTITGTGSIVLAADQTGNANYSPATEVQRTVVIAKASVTLTGPATQPIAVGATQGASIPVTITGQFSGSQVAPPSGSISFSILNSSNATAATGSVAVSGSSVVVPVPATLAGGAYSVVLNYSGDANYATATQTISIVVQQFQPVIVWAQPAPVPYGTTLANVLTAVAQDQMSSPAKTVPGTYVYTQGSAVVTTATVLPVGTYTLLVNFTPSDPSAYKPTTGSITLTVTKAAAVVTLQASAATVLLQNPVTLTATASGNGAPATGSITFLEGSTTLGSGTLVNGVATFTTSSLGAGTHSITAVYAGDTNFTAQTSSAATVQITDFGFTLASGSSTSLTIPRGSTATYGFTLSPTGSSTFPSAINLTVSGLPGGATYTIAPQTVLAGSGATNVTLTINIPAQLSMMRKVEGLAPLTLALLLLPFSGRVRRRAGKLTRLTAALVLLVGGAVGAATLTGCASGSGSGSGPQGPQTFNVVITGTSGTLSHSTTVTLTVQ